MDIVIVFLAVLIALFIIAYLTRRRFGVLGLALAAGAMLSSLWAESLTPIISRAGISVDHPPLITVVSVALVLLPAIVLLFSGPSYKKPAHRLIAALLFALLALAFLVEPLGSAFVLSGDSKNIYDFFITNRVYIVTAGLIIAIFDLLAARSSKDSRHSAH